MATVKLTKRRLAPPQINTAGVAALDDTIIDDNVIVFVKSIGRIFRLDKSSSAATNNLTVVTTLSGTGRWLAIGEHFTSVASSAAMVALGGNPGDIAQRTDLNNILFLRNEGITGTAADWTPITDNNNNILMRVKASGSGIVLGAAVWASGIDTDNITPVVSTITSTDDLKCVGIATASIPNGSYGEVMVKGYLQNVPVSGSAGAGGKIFSTGTAGALDFAETGVCVGNALSAGTGMTTNMWVDVAQNYGYGDLRVAPINRNIPITTNYTLLNVDNGSVVVSDDVSDHTITATAIADYDPNFAFYLQTQSLFSLTFTPTGALINGLPSYTFVAGSGTMIFLDTTSGNWFSQEGVKGYTQFITPGGGDYQPTADDHGKFIYPLGNITLPPQATVVLPVGYYVDVMDIPLPSGVQPVNITVTSPDTLLGLNQVGFFQNVRIILYQKIDDQNIWLATNTARTWTTYIPDLPGTYQIENSPSLFYLWQGTSPIFVARLPRANSENSIGLGETVTLKNDGSQPFAVETYGGGGLITVKVGQTLTATLWDNSTFTGSWELSLPLESGNNLQDLTNIAVARAALGLGSAAVQNTGFFLQTANNLSDLPSIPTALTNLGFLKVTTVSSTTHTLAIADINSLLVFTNSSSPSIVSIPLNASVAIPIGAEFTIFNATGTQTVASATAMPPFLLPDDVDVGNDGYFKLKKVGTDTWIALDVYEQLSFTWTFGTGVFVTPISATFTLTRIMNDVTINFPDIIGTMSTPGIITSASLLPARFAPNVTTYHNCPVENASVNQPIAGMIKIGTPRTVTFSLDSSGANFTTLGAGPLGGIAKYNIV